MTIEKAQALALLAKALVSAAEALERSDYEVVRALTLEASRLAKRLTLLEMQ